MLVLTSPPPKNSQLHKNWFSGLAAKAIPSEIRINFSINVTF